MPLSISVFGVCPREGAASVCYVQVRSIRSVGRYPAPLLPANLSPRGFERLKIDPGAFELQIWEAVLTDAEAARFDADLRSGILKLPDRCPIEPGVVLEGGPLPETLLRETYGRVPVDGAGTLRSRGFALDGGAVRVIAALQAAVGRPEVGEELNALLTALDKETGLQAVMNKPTLRDPRTGPEGLVVATRRLAFVEYLFRGQPEADAPPLVTTVIKPPGGRRGACHEIVLTRSPAVPAIDLHVRLKAKAWDAVILDRLLNLPAATSEFKIDAGSHITELVVGVFDASSGELIDQDGLSFNQQINIGLSGQTTVDVLPPPFRAAPPAGDLVERRRVSTSTFAIGGAKDRIDRFGVMLANASAVDKLAGGRAWKAETLFFPPGIDPQLDVIRWIKQRIEDVNIQEAFLIDPYLGTEALKRVVLRQGNESIKLTILVSPAAVDPDADATDVTVAAGKHVDELVATANALLDQLCGDIEIVHVQRGTGTRQAFHDRFLGLVSRDGTPRVYLLSNSLSKAAGDWPFTIAELDTQTSWRIAAYVTGLTSGNDGSGKQLEAQVVWRSPDRQQRQGLMNGGLADPFAEAILRGYFALSEINGRSQIELPQYANPIIDQIVHAVPANYDSEQLAETLIEGMNGRAHLVVPIIRRLFELDNFAPVAARMGEILLEQVLDRLTFDPRKMSGLDERREVLRAAGSILSRRPKGTDFVRDRMNPVVDAYAHSLEIGRTTEGQLKRLISGIHLVLIALYLVSDGGDVPQRFRIGIAKDYVNLLGRLLRSLTSRRHFKRRDTDGPDNQIDPIGEDDAREAIRLIRELVTVAEMNLTQTAEILFTDPLIPAHLLT